MGDECVGCCLLLDGIIDERAESHSMEEESGKTGVKKRTDRYLHRQVVENSVISLLTFRGLSESVRLGQDSFSQ